MLLLRTRCMTRTGLRINVYGRSNRAGDMADFRFFKMASAAILDFGNFKFLSVGTLERVELRLRAKFWRKCSKRG